MSEHVFVVRAIVTGVCVLALLVGGSQAAFVCDFEEPAYSTTGGSDGEGSLQDQNNWNLYYFEGGPEDPPEPWYAQVSTENPNTGTQSLKVTEDAKMGNDLGEDFGDEVTLKVSLSRDGTDAGAYGGIFVYLGAEGVDEADWSKVAAQFGLGLNTAVVTYRDGGSYVTVAPFVPEEWYNFEASIHFDAADPDGGSYDLKITSTDPNWTDYSATGIKFRGGAAAVGAEDITLNRFQGGVDPAWVDDLLIVSTDELALDGDLNSDGFVGGDDLDIVRSFWGQNVPAGDLLQGDPSGDGFVGGDDLDIVRANWGQGTPPAPSAVPEPASWILLLVGAVFAMAAGWRRVSR